MSRTVYTIRRTSRWRPRLERLEPRLALSASPPGDEFDTTYIVGPDAEASDPSGATAEAASPYLSVVAIDPSGSAPLTTPPSSFSVTFDRPLDPSSFSGNDVWLQKREGSGWVNLYDDLNAPDEELDPTQTVLTFTLRQPLTPGEYRLVLPQFSMLMGADGSFVDDTGGDQVLGGFTVSQPGVRLADAQDLGTVGGSTLALPGSLDLQADPGAVRLYKFTVAPGHFWRLAAEVTAQRDGSPLAASLTLFDALGRPISVASVGRPDAPRDPYLFAGLAPGTYYLGVSGQGNVPTAPGGYDPVSGRRGTITNPQAGGPFTLHLAADAYDSSVRLLGAALNYADPLDPTPSGFTLAFSGLLDINTLRGDPSPGLVVVDQSGRTFPVTAVSFNETTAHYYFMFNGRLPAGRYTVRVADKAQGGLTDLAGLTPNAPGLPAGVLMTFSVGRNNANPDPRDLGTLYDNVHQGITRTDTVLPGASVTYRFVAPASGPFRLETVDSAGTLRVQVLGSGFSGAFAGGAAGQSQYINLSLKAGIYYVQFINTGQTAITLRWTLSETVKWDSLLDNGVGQGPAMNLRFVNPTSADLGAPPVEVAPTGPAASSPQFGPAGSPVGEVVTPPTPAGREATGAEAAAKSVVAPSGLLLTLGNTLVGRPTTPPLPPPTGGNAGAGETVAFASLMPGVPQSFDGEWSSLRFGIADGTVDDLASNVLAPDLPRPVPEPVNGALVAEAAEGAQADNTVIAAADWFTRAGDAVGRLLALRPFDTAASPAPDGPIALARDDAPVAPNEEQVEQAQLTPPLVVGIATLVTVGFRRPLVRWIRRAAGLTDSRAPRRTPKGIQGPHTPV